MTPQIAPEAIPQALPPHMNMFEDTKAWLTHVAAVEAGLSLRRRQTALQRQWLDAQGWSGDEN